MDGKMVERKRKARQVTDAELLLIHEANQRRCAVFLKESLTGEGSSHFTERKKNV